MNSSWRPISQRGAERGGTGMTADGAIVPAVDPVLRCTSLDAAITGGR